MPTVYDVPADELIKRVGEYLKENIREIIPPSWSAFTKTSSHLERPPQIADWWYTRCASIMRKVYVKGPIGVERLKNEYGGRARKGAKREHKRSGGGAIIRNALQQLENAKLVKKIEKRGRKLTESGFSLMDRMAAEVKKKLEKQIPDLKKYG
ncbi:MAG: 30S ribosomal protein S19e [Candidatus Bathyarchaeota archaeon]|nr:MAG: 30S ribosomal protein S19e [Candidatus Bathyarchaeota archaeon]